MAPDEVPHTLPIWEQAEEGLRDVGVEAVDAPDRVLQDPPL